MAGLGLEHRGIGRGQQPVPARRSAEQRSGDHPEARVDLDLAVIQPEGVGQGRVQPLCQPHGQGRARVTREDRELVPTEPCHQGATAGPVTQAVRHLHQQRVTRGVPETVVDGLETVEVAVQQRQVLSGRERGLELPGQQHPVGQAGERVVGRCVLHPGVRLLGVHQRGRELRGEDPQLQFRGGRGSQVAQQPLVPVRPLPRFVGEHAQGADGLTIGEHEGDTEVADDPAGACRIGVADPWVDPCVGDGQCLPGHHRAGTEGLVQGDRDSVRRQLELVPGDRGLHVLHDGHRRSVRAEHARSEAAQTLEGAPRW